jgi:hypothetical protein
MEQAQDRADFGMRGTLALDSGFRSKSSEEYGRHVTSLTN